MDEFFEHPRIVELIENGHIVVVQNEFGEDMLELSPTLADEDPELYDLFTDSLSEILMELERSGLVATGLGDDDESYFYATEFGEEFFEELILSRRRRLRLLEFTAE
jgi:hypothetical protein